MEPHTDEGAFPELAQELRQMFAEDQELRNQQSAIPEAEKAEWLQKARQRDRAHTLRLKEIIAAHGWPTRSLVGVSGGMAAWLIAQHSDQDVAFQRECLRLLEAVAEQGQASREHLAYLTDRVLINEGKPQLYGTQYYTDSEGRDIPSPIEDEANVDKRRLQMGMKTMEQHRQWLASL